MKNFNGKAIYNPSGKAGEYSYWACNFFTGCSNGCDYCYCKKGILAKAMGGDVPVLKKCFNNEEHALDIFEKEVFTNKEALKEHGLFFSFTTDPMLPETISLTEDAIGKAQYYGIPCKILTKAIQWVDEVIEDDERYNDHRKDLIAYGFTLTGCDEREPNASLNMDRVRAMVRLHNAGFKTWASIEPVIDIPKSLAVINLSSGSCDLYKVGLMSGKRYSKSDLQAFVQMLIKMYPENKFYFKDTLLKQAEIDRSSLPSNCVGRDYNIFK